MGQQQLLLIVLSVIIVGIAVVVGINMFSSQSYASNQDAVTNDLLHYGSIAQQLYMKPTALGGTGQDFSQITAIGQLEQDTTSTSNSYTNANGVYTIASQTADQVVIQGTGNYEKDGNIAQIQATVTSETISISASEVAAAGGGD